MTVYAAPKFGFPWEGRMGGAQGHGQTQGPSSQPPAISQAAQGGKEEDINGLAFRASPLGMSILPSHKPSRFPSQGAEGIPLRSTGS